MVRMYKFAFLIGLLSAMITPVSQASDYCPRALVATQPEIAYPVNLASGAQAAFWTIFKPMADHLVYTVYSDSFDRQIRFFDWLSGRVDTGPTLRDERGSIFAVLEYEGRQAVAIHSLVRNAPGLPAHPGQSTGPQETHHVRLFDVQNGTELHSFTLRIHSPSSLNGLAYSRGHFLVLDSHKILWHVDRSGRSRDYAYGVQAVKLGHKGEFWIHSSLWSPKEGRYDNRLERHDDLENFVVTTELGLSNSDDSPETIKIDAPNDFWICADDRALIARWDGGIEAIKLPTGERLHFWPQSATQVFMREGYIYAAGLDGILNRWKAPQELCN